MISDYGKCDMTNILLSAENVHTTFDWSATSIFVLRELRRGDGSL